mgnify:CR=1 FL=1
MDIETANKILTGIEKSSLVLRVMMDDPERYWGNNEIAEKAGVSAGWVSQICRRLEELRYALRAESRKLKLFRPQDVFQDWVEWPPMPLSRRCTPIRMAFPPASRTGGKNFGWRRRPRANAILF